MRRTWLMLTLALFGCGPTLPSGDGSSSNGSSTGEFGTDESGTDGSGTDGSGTDGSGTDESGTDESGTDESGTDESSTETTGDDGCPTQSYGTLEITDETDLDTLACLVEAQWVYIEGSFTDLSFLSTLEQAETLHIQNSPQLLDLTGLDSLKQVSHLWIYDDPSLVDLAGLPADVSITHLYVGGDLASLTSIAMPPDGAHQLSFGNWQRPDLELLATASPDPFVIKVEGAPLLTDLDNITQCCLEQQAQLRITLSNTPLVTELQGLEPFTELSAFSMYNNPEVLSLAGLQNLEVVDTLEISDHCDFIAGAKLTNLHGLEQLVAVETLQITSQHGLISLEGLPTQITVGFATFTRNPMLDQALVNEWIAAAMPDSHYSCNNANGWPCPGVCPQ